MVRRFSLVALVLLPALAAAHPGPRPSPQPAPTRTRVDPRAARLQQTGTALVAAGTATVVIGGAVGIAGANRVAPCVTAEPCDEEHWSGGVAVPAALGVGAGVALVGMLLFSLGRQQATVTVAPTVRQGGGGATVVGRF